jgi:DNA repair protein RecN (Recombination protein N)
MDVLNHLMSKYGGSTEKIAEYLEKRRAEFEEYKDLDSVLEKLGKQKDEAEEKLKKLCKKAHDLRIKQGLCLEKEITAALTDLNFLKVSFAIEVTEREHYGSDGNDDIRFMISLNPGEKKRPLSEVASGGELSRIMLCIKSLLVEYQGMPTLIFDEIDSGVSGRTAEKMGCLIAGMGERMQVVAITHLPQVASQGTAHLLVYKEQGPSGLRTAIRPLDPEERVREIARLLSGADITPEALANARVLLQRNKSKTTDICA